MIPTTSRLEDPGRATATAFDRRPVAETDRRAEVAPPGDELEGLSASDDRSASVPEFLLRCDAGSAARLLRSVQTTAGNHAATRLIQRQPDGDPQLARQPKPKDAPKEEESPLNMAVIEEIHAMSDDALEAEEAALERRITAIERKRPSDRRIPKLATRLRIVMFTRSNRQSFDDSLPHLRSEAGYREHEAERVWKRLDSFVKTSEKDLSEAEQRMVLFLDYYEHAYKTFSETLAKAKTASEQRRAAIDKWTDFGLGILVGTGVGLAGGLLFEAAEGIAAVAVEAGSEVVESVVGGAVGAGTKVDRKTSFDPSPKINPDLIAKEQWKEIAKAWKGVALVNGTIIRFATYRRTLAALTSKLERPLQEERNPGRAHEYEKALRALDKAGVAAKIDEKLAPAELNLTHFIAAARSPRLTRDILQLEQDLWIQWISQLPLDAISETLDEDVIENHLTNIAVLGPGGYAEIWNVPENYGPKAHELDPRLNVDFGSWTSSSDTFDAYFNAVEVQWGVEAIGRLGVALTPIFPGYVGYVRMRHDAYDDAGEKDPNPSAPEQYLRAEPSGMPATTGQIVKVEDTKPSGVVVTPYMGGRAASRRLSVSDYEVADAPKRSRVRG